MSLRLVDEDANQDDVMLDVELENSKRNDTTPATPSDSKDTTTQKQESPLPWKQLSIVFFIYLVDSLSLTSIFAYIGFIVADFHIVGEYFVEYC